MATKIEYTNTNIYEQYEPIIWKDNETPLNSENLNHIEQGISNVSKVVLNYYSRTVDLESEVFVVVEENGLLQPKSEIKLLRSDVTALQKDLGEVHNALLVEMIDSKGNAEMVQLGEAVRELLVEFASILTELDRIEEVKGLQDEIKNTTAGLTEEEIIRRNADNEINAKIAELEAALSTSGTNTTAKFAEIEEAYKAADAELSKKVQEEIQPKIDQVSADVTILSTTHGADKTAQASIDANQDSKISALETSIKTKADKATTLSGYGITDAYTQVEVNSFIDIINENLIDNYATKENVSEEIDKIDLSPYATKEALTLSTTIIEDLVTTTGVGTLPAGTNLKGMTLIDVIKKLLCQNLGVATYPTFTEPSINVVLDETTAIYGTSFTTTGHVTANRGLINPAYSVGGIPYRAGEVIKYTVNGEDQVSNELTYDFNLTIEKVEAGINEVKVSVTFAQGPQPLDSNGVNYDTPYPETTLETILEVNGLVMAYSGSSSNSVSQNSTEIITDNTAYNKSGFFEVADESGNVTESGYQSVVPAVEVDPETYTPLAGQVVLIPESQKLIGIKYWDELGQAWSWYGNKSAEDSLTHEWKNVGTQEIEITEGTSVTYTKYEFDISDPQNVFGAESYWRFVIE